ncbi:hypothetical protein CDD81_4155 [Ophiocordyceps australis]|uniref:Uncharacterized protein n=1 Tax=Ophiocordyceps australis TaxID=1399860 RepID=A0A2C5XDT4_9HYPO|nr:hypothetical protein CDD81_4155 [Ophiocordyceps australis]
MPSSMLKNGLLALIASAVLGQAASVVKQPSGQVDYPGQDVLAAHDEKIAKEELPSSVLRYGNCYIIKNKNGDELGHQPGPWNYLRFGSGTKKTKFRVCENMGRCVVPHVSSYGQVLNNEARFWLFDLEGNNYSQNGEYVAANSPPFAGGGLTYPGGDAYRYYVNFWGENDCSDADAHLLGSCPVKLRVDNLRDDKGLTIGDNYFKTTPSPNSYVRVTFHATECTTDKNTNLEL